MSSHRSEPQRDQPTARLLARLDPGHPGVRVLAAAAAVVMVAAAVLAWRARPTVDHVTPSSTGPHPSAGSVSSPTIQTPSTLIVVAVTGRVRRPGLVRLPNGARVADAIEAAGGPLPGTDLTMVNLARKVADGELVVVGVAGASADRGAAGSGGPADKPGGGALINLNTATTDQLQTLPGVGPVLASRIVDYRQAHGGFTSVAELREVGGIGEARFAELKDLVTV